MPTKPTIFIDYKRKKKIWFRDKAYEMDKPSIDRIDNDGHYEYDNCQFIEISENSRKSHIDNPKTKVVLQYTKDGIFVKEWVSVTKASKYICVAISTLSACCRGEQKTCKGYKWKYKEKY